LLPAVDRSCRCASGREARHSRRALVQTSGRKQKWGPLSRQTKLWYVGEAQSCAQGGITHVDAKPRHFARCACLSPRSPIQNGRSPHRRHYFHDFAPTLPRRLAGERNSERAAGEAPARPKSSPRLRFRAFKFFWISTASPRLGRAKTQVSGQR